MLGGSDAGPGEWQEGSSAARQLLAEMQECFAILDEQQQDQQQRPHPEQAQQEAAAAAAEADGMQWEDVAAAEPTPAGERDPGLAEGLAAYGAGHAPDAEAAGTSAAQPDGGSGGGGGGGGGGGDADMDVVLETLAGLYRQLTNRTLPQVQEWLGVLGRVEPEGAAQEQQRQQLLRAATQLRGQLAAAKARCEASDLDLQALLLQRRRRQREQQQQSEGQAGEADAPAVATALQDLFGGSGSEGEDDGEGSGSGEGALGKQRQQQQQQRNRRHSGQRDAAAGRSSQRQQGRQEEEEEWESPYLRIVDPAAPRPRPQASDAAGQQRKQQEARGDRAAAAAARRESSLPEDVRKKLAAQVRAPAFQPSRCSGVPVPAPLPPLLGANQCLPHRSSPAHCSPCRPQCCPQARTPSSGTARRVSAAGPVDPAPLPCCPCLCAPPAGAARAQPLPRPPPALPLPPTHDMPCAAPRSPKPYLNLLVSLAL